MTAAHSATFPTMEGIWNSFDRQCLANPLIGLLQRLEMKKAFMAGGLAFHSMQQIIIKIAERNTSMSEEAQEVLAATAMEAVLEEMVAWAKSLPPNETGEIPWTYILRPNLTPQEP